MTNIQELLEIKYSGNKYYNNKNFTLAISEYSLIIDKLKHFLPPNNKNASEEYKEILLHALGNRCASYLQLNLLESATNDALTCCKIDPNSVKSLLRLGNCYTRSNKIVDAIGAYRQILFIDPHNQEARAMIAKLQTSSSSSSSNSPSSFTKFSDVFSSLLSKAYYFFITYKDPIILACIAIFLYYYFFQRPSYSSYSSYSSSSFYTPYYGLSTTGWILLLVCAYYLPPRFPDVLGPSLARPFFGFSMLNFIWLVDFLLKLRNNNNHYYNRRRSYY